MLDNRRKTETLLFQHVGVTAFRGVENVHLEHLGRLNLLVGMNNSGKTSILEAVAVLCSGVDPVAWSATARLRERGPFDPMSGIDALRWLFPHHGKTLDSFEEDGDDADEHLPLQLTCGGRSPLTSIYATCSRIKGILPEALRRTSLFRRGMYRHSRTDDDEEEIEDEGWLIAVEPKYGEDFDEGGPSRVEIPLWSSVGIHRSHRRVGKAVRFEFLSPYAHRNQPNNLRRLTASVVEGGRSDVVALLNRLDPNIRGLEILTTGEGRRPILAIDHRRSGLIPANVLGDGARRALSIALAVQSARGGALLVDELEAALHVSALDVVFPWLAEACGDMNVQLFATTHSLEAVDAIVRGEPGRLNEIVAFRLDEENGEDHSKRYDADMLNRLVHERGLDIR